MRVSALNTNLGEKIVIRILDYSKSAEGLESLGLTEKNLAKLKKMIEPFVLRRIKKDVLTELPDKIEQKIIIDLEKEHKRAYKGYVNLITRKIKENNWRA